MKIPITLLLLILSASLAYSQSPSNNIRVERDTATLSNHVPKIVDPISKFAQENSGLQLDSMIHKYYTKHDGAPGNLSSGYKEAYQYNPDGYMTATSRFSKNLRVDKWVLTGSESHTIEQGNAIRKIIYSWNDDGEINTVRRRDYTFDDNGNPVLELSYRNDDSTGNWENYRKEEYTYDDNGNQVLKIDYTSNSEGELYAYRKVVEEFDEHRNLIKSADSSWDGTLNEWKASLFSEEYKLNYNANNQLKEKNRFYLDETLNNEDDLPSTQTLYTYNTDGQLVNQEINVYSSRNNSMVLDMRISYEYDNQGLLTHFIEYQDNDHRQPGITKLVPREKEQYQYNNADNKVTKFSYISDEESSDWILTEKEYYYYSQKNFATSNASAKQVLRVYPNPAQDYIVFNVKENIDKAYVELSHVNEGMLIRQDIKHDNKVSIGHLDKGVYIYNVILNQSIKAGKIIIK